MLVEKSRDEALKAFLRGRKVLVLTEYDDGDMMAEDLARWLTEENTRYLVSVPAVEKEEFAALGRTSKPAIPDPEADPVVDMDPAEEGASVADVFPAADSFSDSGKSKSEVVRELCEQGLTVKEIEEKTGYKRSTIYKYYQRRNEEKEGGGKDSDPAGAAPEELVDNKDRHLCKTCQYRGEGGKNGCDYAYITGKARGCKVEECGRYVKGSRLKAPKGL